LRYSPMDLGAVGPPPTEAMKTDIFNKSLLERAGLERPAPTSGKEEFEHDRHSDVRYDISKDDPGQLRFRNQPR
jgi:hypothetical protein